MIGWWILSCVCCLGIGFEGGFKFSKWSLRHMFGMMSVRAKDELNELLDKYEEDLKK